MAIVQEIAILPEVQLTLTANGGTTGTYTRLKADSVDDDQYTPVNIGPGETVILGPFNKARRYRLVSTTGRIQFEKAFKGVDGVTSESVIAALSAANLELVNPANNDEILIKDSSDDGKLKAVTVQSLIDLVAAGGGVAGTLAHTINLPSHGFAVGQAIAIDQFGMYILADSSDITTSEVVGVVTEVDNIDDFTIVSRGKVNGLSGLQPGCTYFVSDTVAGQLVTTKPYLPDTVVKAVLIAETATSAYIMNYLGVHND